MDPCSEAINKIVKEQKSIIGPIALEMAGKVSGLKIESDKVQIIGNNKEVLGGLVSQYAKLFGKTSIEVCKEAFSSYSNKIPACDIPDILKN
ncbi:MAG: hypothetical protein Q7R43_00435 [Candidatus Daviesbacteria bacterium]|nr:hypothetical protein [Candidatus Daviesbacteria bacterium]